MSEENARIPLGELLTCLADSSAKAARIARTFRGRDELFGLLVEEKSCIEKNRTTRVRDFKTLADVLVQETIKRDVGRKFPALSSKIQGEEQNSFENTLGESIRVELTDSLEETADLLCKVLDGRLDIAQSLAVTVHSGDDRAATEIRKEYSSSEVSVAADGLGVWIDPIDSTAEYIQANPSGCTDEWGIALRGLRCVCVLIGVYALETGEPLLGIIHQPFYEDGTADRWESRVYWGMSCGGERVASASLRATENGRRARKVVVTSCFEDGRLQEILRTRYAVVHAAGAGYKCLAVAEGKADLYVLSLQNTHYWDTCGPHAILTALGGGIVDFHRASAERDPSQLRYLEDSSGNPEFRNRGGLVAYRDPADLAELLELLGDSGYHRREV